ncbi:hypothetical protein BAUCODRAFT_567328 [Baudoinia panamericana UAMH 10762]|uniref:Uncharacterized protein n=1 Tax=Baudoinia panamericana (strain UAMH 10762) TaxID=717646 RepID=M2MB99_BAUPA|nr:uncharacterized protein BAUCODRAFT_567328 [Baudoinia panamericana UAMH 10762]EMC93766.1 hypothetical protein BAUCODRAFT_567328 [Baudoinia panamericana UAMH 10762]
MAPIVQDCFARPLWIRTILANNGGQQATTDAVDGAAVTHATSTTIYLGIGVGVGGAILVAIITVAVQIIRTRLQHRRMIAELESNSEPVPFGLRQQQEIGEVPRPMSAARCSALGALHARAGWGALSSDEQVHVPDSAGQTGRQKRKSIALPKRIKQHGIPLRGLKHLSAIIESPRSKSAKSPSPAMLECTTTLPQARSAESIAKKKAVHLPRQQSSEEDVFIMPGSPKPEVLPSFAIRSPGMYGAAIANDDRPRPPRSASVGAIPGPVHESTVSNAVSRPSRPKIHIRSISLGAPPTQPPSGPVPPLPVIVPHGRATVEASRQGLCVSRMSSSSQESAGSSVLVTSPLLHRGDEGQSVHSPTVEQVVAKDGSAQLKVVTNRQWQNPHVTGPRPNDVRRLDGDPDTDPGLSRQHPSIRSNFARCSNYSGRLSSASTVSSIGDGSDMPASNRLSVPTVATADRVSISRIPASDSLKTSSGHTTVHGAVRKVSTPRRSNRTSSVSANGSPTERRKTGVLRDISGNAVLTTPSRQASQASSLTQDSSLSGRSSNGNPFQWDQSLPLVKPSSLKGSPTSKGMKGHKRQNCVRISILAPQILGPPGAPPARPTSPSIMHGIEEEDGTEGEEGEGCGLVASHRIPRAHSGNSLATQLRAQQPRVSLTPSSPTLSAWVAYQEHVADQARSGNGSSGLPSQTSDSQSSLSVSPLQAKNVGRPTSRQSDRSSAFSIPPFPSPSRATVAAIQMTQPIPQFYLSRPSTDGPEEESSSPIPLQACAGEDQLVSEEDDGEPLPSSPPIPISKHTEYDPAWPTLASTIPREYDPTSPKWPLHAEASAAELSDTSYFPFAVRNNADVAARDPIGEVSPQSQPISYGGRIPDTPPCSPKSDPAELKSSANRARQQETSILSRPGRSTVTDKLTSANASAIMATIPESLPCTGFPTAAPVLPPPHQESPAGTTPMPRRQRAVSSALRLQPLRPPPKPPASVGETIDMPEPLRIRPVYVRDDSSPTSPKGPRSEPAKSVLKNAMALRRMNSEIDHSRHYRRESRLYQRLGREASPLLPWVDSDLEESCNNLFDFDFAEQDAGAGAEEHDSDVTSKGALDEVDVSAIHRRLDGALADFEAEPVSTPSTVTLSERPSSVWENGELFWQRRPQYTFPPNTPASRWSRDTNPAVNNAWGRATKQYHEDTPEPVRFRWLSQSLGGSKYFELCWDLKGDYHTPFMSDPPSNTSLASFIKSSAMA